MNEFTFGGMRVISSPLVTRAPRFELSQKFRETMPPALVASTQAWCTEFFGTYMPVYVMQAEKKMVVDPDTYQKLRLEAYSQGAAR